MMTIYHYHVFGLNIESELEFPELLPRRVTHGEHSDILIRWQPVEVQGIDQPIFKNTFLQAKKNLLWLNIKDVGRFLIADGSQIDIDPIEPIDLATIRLFLLGSCMGALLMQRDLFLLHGNTIKIGEACIAFVGDSGIGKSTLSGAFFKRGYSILADDVCALDANLNVIPSLPQIKLWQDAAIKLGIETQALRKVRANTDKYAIPLADQFYERPLPLKIIYCLNKKSSLTVHLQSVVGLDKIKALQQNSYRYFYLRGLEKEAMHINQCIHVSQQVDLVSISRPEDGFELDALVDKIELDLSSRLLAPSGSF